MTAFNESHPWHQVLSERIEMPPVPSLPATLSHPQPNSSRQPPSMQDTSGQAINTMSHTQDRAPIFPSTSQIPMTWFGGDNPKRSSYHFPLLPVVCSFPEANPAIPQGNLNISQPAFAASLPASMSDNSYSSRQEVPLPAFESNSVPAYVDYPQQSAGGVYSFQLLPDSFPRMSSFTSSSATTGSFATRSQPQDTPRFRAWEQYAEPVITTHRYRCNYPDCRRGEQPFPNRRAIEQHIKGTHLLIRAHVCSVAECGRGFSRAFDLRRHLRSHAPDRPFACKTCGITYKRSDMLIRHRGASFFCQEQLSDDGDQGY